jgi:predicted molibdopterin-dependent oxidoreductase YjgC
MEPNWSFNIDVDGERIPARQGQTIAAALTASGRRVFGRTPDGSRRGLFCGMGLCFECVVTVDGTTEQRACMTLARPGMRIRLCPEPEESGEQD